MHTWRGEVKSEIPLIQTIFLELLQHKSITWGGKWTRGGLKINNCGNPSFARGAVSYPREFCVTHCPGRPGQCLSPAVSHEWHPTADCLGKRNQIILYFISHQKILPPPQDLFILFLLLWFLNFFCYSDFLKALSSQNVLGEAHTSLFKTGI